jgi:hypothetical protein
MGDNAIVRHFPVMVLMLFSISVCAQDLTPSDRRGSVGAVALDGMVTAITGAVIRDAGAAGQAEDEARERAEAEARIRAANEEMERARRSRSLIYFGFRLLLGAALVAVGLLLAAARLKRMAAPAAPVFDALERKQVPIVLAAAAIALIDILLDFRIARPLVGDGLPQLAVLIAGVILGRSLLEGRRVPPKLEQAIERLEANKELVGFGSIALGLVHIVAGAYPLV